MLSKVLFTVLSLLASLLELFVINIDDKLTVSNGVDEVVELKAANHE